MMITLHTSTPFAPTETDPVFPYGTVPISPTFRACYTRDYSREDLYPLSEQLPAHHPLLQQLEGSSPLAYTLPPWWHICVEQVESGLRRRLLADVTAQEFRAGCIVPARFKAFRETLSEEERREFPSSPKIAALLEKTEWEVEFQERGPTETPDICTLQISTQPLDFLYMANGRDWRSCQHCWRGSENQHLPGNFYDTNVAVALLLPPQTRIEESASVLVRTTLRIFRLEERIVVAIGRTYHNSATLALLLLSRIADLLDARQIRWGFMIDTNTLEYCEEELLGPALSRRLERAEVEVESIPCSFPAEWYVPWIDGGDHQWERQWGQERQWNQQDYVQRRLHATLRLMHPRPVPPIPQQPALLCHSFAHLAGIRLHPHFL